MVEKNFFQNAFLLADPKLLHQLSEASRIVDVPKKKLLVEAGEVQLQLPIVLSGVIRGFLLDEDGQDITDCFAFRFGDVVVGCNGLGVPSLVSFETLTDCKLLLLPVSTLLSLMKQNQDLLEVYNKLLVDGMQRHWYAKISLLKYSAMERYQRFLEDYSGLINLVGNKYIASFLGMTPVTLSRLRRQLREEGQNVSIRL